MIFFSAYLLCNFFALYIIYNNLKDEVNQAFGETKIAFSGSLQGFWKEWLGEEQSRWVLILTMNRQRLGTSRWRVRTFFHFAQEGWELSVCPNVVVHLEGERSRDFVVVQSLCAHKPRYRNGLQTWWGQVIWRKLDLWWFGLHLIGHLKVYLAIFTEHIWLLLLETYMCGRHVIPLISSYRWII